MDMEQQTPQQAKEQGQSQAAEGIPRPLQAFIKFMESMGATVSVHTTTEACGGCSGCPGTDRQGQPAEAPQQTTFESFATEAFANLTSAIEKDIARTKNAKAAVRLQVASFLKQRLRSTQVGAADAEFNGAEELVLDELEAQVQELRTLYSLFAVGTVESQQAGGLR